MKIAVVSDVIYPFNKGGMEKRIWEISRRLAKKHEVHLFGMKYWEGENVIIKDGVYLHGVCKPMELYVKGRRSIKEAIFFAWKVLPYLLKEEFDIVDCHEFPYFPCISSKIYSSLKRVPLVVTWHEVWNNYWYEYLGKRGFFGKIIERFVARLSAEHIAVSEHTKRNLEKIGVKGRVSLIPNGIDFEQFTRIKPSDTHSDVIYAGRLIEHKNIDILIRSIGLIKKQIPDIKCITIGDGPEREKLEKLTRDLSLENNIDFLGFLEDYNEVISYMKSSKVFVLPSSREGFGIVALEANACGLPVITINSEMNATKDLIISGENGFICELSEKEIANNIEKSFDAKKKLEGNCVENAKNFDWKMISKLLENTYKEYLRC